MFVDCVGAKWATIGSSRSGASLIALSVRHFAPTTRRGRFVQKGLDHLKRQRESEEIGTSLSGEMS